MPELEKPFKDREAVKAEIRMHACARQLYCFFDCGFQRRLHFFSFSSLKQLLSSSP